VAHVGWLPLPSGNRSNRGDVAEAAMYFATDRYLTGAVLPVDGGIVASAPQ
jgi:hypothetical protein